MSLWSRRKFIVAVPGFISLAGFASLAKNRSHDDNESLRFKPDVLAPNEDVQLSANLFLGPSAVLIRQTSFEITGQGHSHEVVLSEQAWTQIIKTGKAVVRSAIGGGKNSHSHWVLVKLQS